MYNNKLWLEKPSNLFCSFNVVPLSHMTLEEQLNAITRLVLFVFLILVLLNFKHSSLFLLLSLLFIIILYYIQRNQMERFNTERYVNKQYQAPRVQQYVKDTRDKGVRMQNGRIAITEPTTYRFCDTAMIQNYNDPEYMSANQKLAGKPNPKTLVSPVSVPPSHDLDYWKANNLINHSGINRESQQEAYQSGFQVSNCCGNVNDEYLVPDRQQGDYLTGSGYGYRYLDEKDISERHEKEMEDTQNDIQEDFRYPYHKNDEYNEQPYYRENYVYPCTSTTEKGEIRQKRPGEVNTACGYNPSQLREAGLPTNYPAGNCQKDPVYKQYNENLFTQIIEPGVYTRNEINEPINSNMGISFTQQFEPTTCRTTKNGSVIYREHDPNIIEPVMIESETPMVEPVTEYNVYDPRHSGYGTSYRSYNDHQLGQTRFMYDDINAIRMPNYITRSNIDHQPYADQYGPIQAGREYGNEFNSKIRALANDSFTRATIQQRTDLQERLMRKVNAEGWQQRQAPIRTGGQLMSGGMGFRC